MSAAEVSKLCELAKNPDLTDKDIVERLHDDGHPKRHVGTINNKIKGLGITIRVYAKKSRNWTAKETSDFVQLFSTHGYSIDKLRGAF